MYQLSLDSLSQGAVTDFFLALSAAMASRKATYRGQQSLSYMFDMALWTTVDEMSEVSRLMVCDYLEIEQEADNVSIQRAFKKFTQAEHQGVNSPSTTAEQV